MNFQQSKIYQTQMMANLELSQLLVVDLSLSRPLRHLHYLQYFVLRYDRPSCFHLLSTYEAVVTLLTPVSSVSGIHSKSHATNFASGLILCSNSQIFCSIVSDFTNCYQLIFDFYLPKFLDAGQMVVQNYGISRICLLYSIFGNKIIFYIRYPLWYFILTTSILRLCFIFRRKII